jgi:hypothetical protein
VLNSDLAACRGFAVLRARPRGPWRSIPPCFGRGEGGYYDNTSRGLKLTGVVPIDDARGSATFVRGQIDHYYGHRKAVKAGIVERSLKSRSA